MKGDFIMTSAEIKEEAKKLLAGKWNKLAIITFLYTFLYFLFSSFTAYLGKLLNLPIITLLDYAIILPLSFGVICSFLKVLQEEDVSYLEFFTEGFSNFGRVFGVFGNVLLKLILPIILMIVFLIMFSVGLAMSATSIIFASSSASSFSIVFIIGLIGWIGTLIYIIPKSFSYYLSYFILRDHPEMKGKEIVAESARLMEGNRWKLFYLCLSFIGWSFLLAICYSLVLYILNIFLPVYIAWLISIVAMYVGIAYLSTYLMTSVIVFYQKRVEDSTESSSVKPVEGNNVEE